MQKMSNTIHHQRVLTIGSTTLTLREWAKRGKLSYYTLKWRVDQGWPSDRLFERREGFQEGVKVCSACGETKPSEGYYKRSRGGWYSECKACHKKRVISNTSAHK
jgi:hypothetical protein